MSPILTLKSTTYRPENSASSHTRAAREQAFYDLYGSRQITDFFHVIETVCDPWSTLARLASGLSSGRSWKKRAVAAWLKTPSAHDEPAGMLDQR